MRKNKLEVSVNRFEDVKTIAFDDAVQSFEDDRRRIGARESTITYYLNQLGMFRRFMLREYDQILLMNEITLPVLESFIDYLFKVRGNSAGGINAKIRALRTFLFYCEEVGFITTNYARSIKQIKTDETIIQTFSMKQITSLLEQPDLSKFTGLRNYVLMLVLIDTGMRISEALELKAAHINFEENRIHVRKSKGRLSRFVPLSPRLKKEIKQYLAIHGDNDNYLFCNLNDERIDRNSYRLILQAYGKKAGIKGVRVSPHTFRHTFAKFYIMNGGDVFSLMQILGHTQLDMTRRYVRLFGTDIDKKHRQFSPLNNM